MPLFFWDSYCIILCPILQTGVPIYDPIEWFLFFLRSGGSISSAKVGDELAIHFEVEDINSPYEIFVRDLVASDGVVSDFFYPDILQVYK